MLQKALALWSIIKSMTPGVSDKMSDVTSVLKSTTSRLEALKIKRASMRQKIDVQQEKLQLDWDKARVDELDASLIIAKIKEAFGK